MENNTEQQLRDEASSHLANVGRPLSFDAMIDLYLAGRKQSRSELSEKDKLIKSLQNSLKEISEQLKREEESTLEREPKYYQALKQIAKPQEQLTALRTENERLKSGWIDFNLNDTIMVKLYDKGYQLLADEHNSYLGQIPTWERRNADYFKSKADKDGYTSFQAWQFIEHFGPVTKLGMQQYYALDIRVKNTLPEPPGSNPPHLQKNR